jgi:hypothetical protein
MCSKNYVLTWKNTYWLRETIRLFPPLTELVECYPIVLFPKFQHISQNFIPPLPEGGGGYTVLPLSVCPSVQDIFRRIFHSNCWWQKSDIWSQASYRYTILWVAFLERHLFITNNSQNLTFSKQLNKYQLILQ